MPEPKFDIIITAYNALPYLKRCLRSIKKYTAGWNYKITVVDCASNDGTKFYLKNKKGINLLSLKKNFGPSRAFNEGLKATDGEFIVKLDDDTEVTSGWLDSLYKSLVADGKIGIVGAKSVLDNGKIFLVDDLAKYYNIFGYREIDRGQRDYVRYCDLVSGSTILLRRSLFDEIGFFDERLGCYEDWDFCLRTRVAGYKILYNGKCKIVHHHLYRCQDSLAKYQKIFHKKWSNFKMFPLKDSHPVDRYNTRGLDGLAQGKYKKALHYFEKASAIDKRFSVPLFMGIALLKMDRLKEATRKFKEALGLNPSDFRAYYYLGMIYKKIGAKEKAHNFFQKALRKTPLEVLENSGNR